MHDLLIDAARRGIRYRVSLADRCVSPTPAAVAVNSRASANRCRRTAVLPTCSRARRGRLARHGRDGRRALLRLRDRRLAAGRARGELARRRLGPERRAERRRRRSPPRSRRSLALAARAARPAGADRRRLRHRRDDGELHRRSPRRATRVLRAPAGTSKRKGCSARRRSRSSSATKCTSACSRRSACSGSAATACVRVPVDDQGRMRADALPRDRRPDDRLPAGRQREHRRLRSARRDRARRRDEPARGSTSTARSACGPRPRRRSAHLVAGVDRADSWATDAHKWLNVPYDSGLAFVRDAARAARGDGGRAPPTCRPASRASRTHYTPELSRRARGVEVWAALRSLGRAGWPI